MVPLSGSLWSRTVTVAARPSRISFTSVERACVDSAIFRAYRSVSFGSVSTSSNATQVVLRTAKEQRLQLLAGESTLTTPQQIIARPMKAPACRSSGRGSGLSGPNLGDLRTIERI
jgi:hypothetical protein